MNTQQHTLIKMVLDAWHTHLKRTEDLIGSLSDEQLQQQVSGGRNTGVYLLGHLVAVHDALLPLLGFGEKVYPQLEEVFIKNPDRSGLAMPGIHELHNYWHLTNERLAEEFAKLTPDQWFQRHASVSEEEFLKEPHRNKLNVVISRTNHLASHLGQLLFLKR